MYPSLFGLFCAVSADDYNERARVRDLRNTLLEIWLMIARYTFTMVAQRTEYGDVAECDGDSSHSMVHQYSNPTRQKAAKYLVLPFFLKLDKKENIFIFVTTAIFKAV